MQSPRYIPSPHVIALLMAAATFSLIFMGGLVTSHQAGMSVPDWPNSYGYNIFLFPPRLWIGGILYEQPAGALVGDAEVVPVQRREGFRHCPVPRFRRESARG
jgi:hypothetical protein